MKQLKISKQITNREAQSLDKYLNDISKVALITSEEESFLAQRIRDGDHIALEKLTKANLRFVVSVAKQYQNYGLNLGDLINEGNIGLIKAAKRFDETRGFKFISYAVWWIRQAIMQSLAEHSRIVRLPLNRVSGINKIHKTFAVLEQKYQREPTTQELADSMGVSFADISQNQSRTKRHISFDAPLEEGENNSLLDVFSDLQASPPDSEMEYNSLKIDIQRALSGLSRREYDVVVCYFGLNGESPQSLEELGERFHLTKERVRQIKENATRWLRTPSRNKSLKAYL